MTYKTNETLTIDDCRWGVHNIAEFLKAIGGYVLSEEEIETFVKSKSLFLNFKEPNLFGAKSVSVECLLNPVPTIIIDYSFFGTLGHKIKVFYDAENDTWIEE